MDSITHERTHSPVKRKPAAGWDVPHPAVEDPVIEKMMVAPPPPEAALPDLPARSGSLAGLVIAQSAGPQRPAAAHAWRAVALGALLGPLSVVIYAHLYAEQARARAQIIVAGLEGVVLMLAAAILATVLFRFAAAVLERRPWLAEVGRPDPASLAR
jgi:hypothetical protein